MYSKSGLFDPVVSSWRCNLDWSGDLMDLMGRYVRDRGYQFSSVGNVVRIYRDSVFYDHAIMDARIASGLRSAVKDSFSVRDSLRSFADSVDAYWRDIRSYRVYRLDYVSISSSALSSCGVDWTHPLASGQLSFDLLARWSLDCYDNNDSLYERRSVLVPVRDTISSFVNFGSQRQILSQVVASQGIQTNSYVYRDYGLTLSLVMDHWGSSFADYQIRQLNEDYISARIPLADTTELSGTLKSVKTSRSGISWLSSLPLVGWFFEKKTGESEYKIFALRVFLLSSKKDFTQNVDLSPAEKSILIPGQSNNNMR